MEHGNFPQVDSKIFLKQLLGPLPYKLLAIGEDDLVVLEVGRAPVGNLVPVPQKAIGANPELTVNPPLDYDSKRLAQTGNQGLVI